MNINKTICPICGYSLIVQVGEGLTRILDLHGVEISRDFSYNYRWLTCKNNCHQMYECKSDDEYNFISTMTNAGVQVRSFIPENTGNSLICNINPMQILHNFEFNPAYAYVILVPTQWNIKIMLDQIIDDILSDTKYQTLKKILKLNAIYIMPSNYDDYCLPEEEELFLITSRPVFHEFYKELTMRFRDILGLY